MTDETPKMAKPKPTFTVKLKDVRDGENSFIAIGAAWLNDNGSIYVKLNEPMSIMSPFYLFRITQ